MNTHREWIDDISSRGSECKCCNREHVSLTDLKIDHPDNSYLRKENIPYYPEYVFSVSKVCHVTNQDGLHGIIKDRGFRGKNSFLWWDLKVTADDCVKAKIKFNNSQEYSWQSPEQMPPFLENFTTSPAFKSESRYGNFRFTFGLRQLLNLYSKQYCRRTAPILRLMNTQLYKQQILYSVLVHPRYPRYMTHYRKYPRLPINDDFLCAYSQGLMSWHCQSPSDNYEYSLELDDGGEVNATPLHKPEYYVWDHVAVAFHMKEDRVLRVGREELFRNLSVCEMASGSPEMSVEKAEEEIEALKEKYLWL